MPFLPDTLASIAGQTYQNQQIIVWENGSTDGTLQELQNWIPSKIPGRIVVDRAMPLAQSLAALVEEADTELCARIDADDIAAPDRIAQQVAFLDSNPETAVVGSQMREIDADGKTLQDRRPYPSTHDDIVNTMVVENPVGHPAVLFRKSAVIEAGNYRSVPIAEDFDLWMRIAVKHKIVNLDEKLTSYRVHAKSATRIQQGENRLQSAVNLLIAERAPELFGVSTKKLLQLRERRMPYAMTTINAIASHLDRSQGREHGQTMRQVSFLDAVRCLIAPWDRPSGILIARSDPRPGAYARELRAAIYDCSPKVGLLKHVLPIARRFKEYQEKSKMRRWTEQFSSSLPAQIDKSLIVTGREDFPDFIKSGQYGWIERDVMIWSSADDGADPQLTIGKRTFIGQHTVIGVFQPVSIGSYSMIGAYCYLISANHRYERRDIPMGEQGFSGAPIVLEEDVWLGTHVVVLPGVTIGKGAIVAAGSIVNKSIPPYEIWGGTPAKFIRERP